jgi:hypothetical protein
MTKPEFNTWLKEYSAAFPDTAAWLNTSGDRNTTLGFWFQALQSVDLVDAKEVTRRMAVGEEPSVLPYEREATARMVATVAKRVRSGKRIVRREEMLPDYGGPTWNSGGIYLAVLEGVKAGKSVKQLCAELIPQEDNPRRYKCLRCLDSGVVLVWSNQTIHAVMKRAEVVPRKRCTVRCVCEANKKWSETFSIYEESKFCLFSGYDELHEVEQWCEVYRSLKLQRMENHEPSFDSWNNR